jgi:hypothetical protein
MALALAQEPWEGEEGWAEQAQAQAQEQAQAQAAVAVAVAVAVQPCALAWLQGACCW